MVRSWAIAVTASMPWPMTSPMTRPTEPSGSTRASYQSPPTTVRSRRDGAADQFQARNVRADSAQAVLHGAREGGDVGVVVALLLQFTEQEQARCHLVGERSKADQTLHPECFR